MRLTNDFSVRTDPASAFAALSDLEQLVGCVPGATFEGREGDVYTGRVGLRIGPVSMDFASTATLVEYDEAQRRLALRGEARDRRGQGNVQALVTLNVAEGAPGESSVRVDTDLDLTGRMAQFGGAAINHVNRRIMNEFVSRLDEMLAARGVVPAQTGHAAAAPSATTGTSYGVVDLAQRGAPAAAAVLAGILLGLVIARAIRRMGDSVP